MRIIITDCDHANVDQELEVIATSGLEAPLLLQCHTEDEVIKGCKGAKTIINQYVRLTYKVFEALAPELKHVAHYGVGVNNIDIAAATTFGVQVCNVPDYGMHEVSDHAMAMMLALARKIVFMNNRTKAGEWDYTRAIPLDRLCAMTVGIVGLGRNGLLFAKKSAAFGSRVIGYDPYYKQSAGADAPVTILSLEELIRESDFISIHCPLTDGTRNMFSDDAFKKMKSSAYIINTSRGGIVNETALARALENKEIAGAALDTTEQEPLQADSPLRKFDNCIITPHIAWYSTQAYPELKRKTAEEAVRMATGKKPHYPVNTLA